MTTPSDLLHAKLVIQRGLANEEQVAQCLNDLKENLTALPLLDLLIERGFIAIDQAEIIRTAIIQEARTHDDLALGKRIVLGRLATAAQVQECFAVIQDLRKKGAQNLPRLGQLLLARGYVTEEDITTLLESPSELELLDDPSQAARRETAQQPEVDPYDIRLLDPSGAPPLAPPPRRSPTATPPKLAIPPPGARATGPEPTPAGGRRPPAAAMPAVRCAFCGTEIRAGVARQPCPRCKDAYHPDCWTKSGGCVREECRSGQDAAARKAKVLASHEFSLWQQIRPLAGKIGAGLVVVALAIAGWTWLSHDAQYYYDLGKAVDKRSKADAARPWCAADLHLGNLMAGESTTGAITSIERAVQLEEKIHNFKIAVDKNPAFAAAWYELGVAYFELKRYQEALNSLKKAIDLEPNSCEAVLCLGSSAEQLGDLAAAEREYRQAIQINPGLSDPHELLGILLDTKLEGRHEEAAAEYRQVLKTKPGNAPIASRLAQILVDQKKYPEALALIEQVEKLAPGSLDLKLKRAQLYFAQGEWAKALESAEPIAAAQTEAFEARKIQAIALHKLGRSDEAYVVGKAITASLQDPELYLLTGELALQYGEPEAGIGFLRNAFTLSRQPAIVERIGDAFLRMGRAEEAKNAFEELRSIQSSNPKAAFKLALAAATGTDMVKAAAAVRELRSRNASDPDLAAVEARIQRQAGEAGPALERLKAIIAESPKSYYAHFQMGVSLREGAQPFDALAELRTAFDLEADPEALFEIGLSLVALKKETNARDMMKRYMEQVPFGRNLDKARSILQIGGATTASTEADPYAYALKICNDYVAKLSTGNLPNNNPWIHSTAALYAAAAMAQVLAGDQGKSQNAAMVGNGYFTQLMVAQANPSRPEFVNAEDERFAGDWLIALPGLGDALIAVIVRRDKGKTRGADLERIIDARKNGLDAAATVEWRVNVQVRTVTDLLELLARLVDGSDSGRARIDRIETLRIVQLECCSGGLQSICGELYTAVQLADQLVGVQDRAKVYDEPRRSAMGRFEQREGKARKVVEQIRNAVVTLSEQLTLIASNPALRP